MTDPTKSPRLPEDRRWRSAGQDPNHSVIMANITDIGSAAAGLHSPCSGTPSGAPSLVLTAAPHEDVVDTGQEGVRITPGGTSELKVRGGAWRQDRFGERTRGRSDLVDTEFLMLTVGELMRIVPLGLDLLALRAAHACRRSSSLRGASGGRLGGTKQRAAHQGEDAIDGSALCVEIVGDGVDQADEDDPQQRFHLGPPSGRDLAGGDGAIKELAEHGPALAGGVMDPIAQLVVAG